MNSGTRSVVAIVAGLAAFFAAGAIVFGVCYVVVIHILPQPDDWRTLRTNVEGMLGFQVSVAIGSIVGGYITSRVAGRARFVHSLGVIAVLVAMRQGYILWGPHTLWDEMFGPVREAALVCLPFFALGTWLGACKLLEHRVPEQRETKP
jgi:MFS family permease